MTRQSLRRSGLFAALLVQSVVLTTASTVSAALITWGAPTNISGATDVSTTGTLVGAFSLGDTLVAGTNVNGVAFQGFAVPSGSLGATVGNFAISSPLSLFSDNTSFGDALNAPFNTLALSYQSMLASGVSGSANTPWTLTMSGLTAGVQYEFQWWSSFSVLGSDSHTGAGSPLGGSVTLVDNVTATQGGLGQYAIGTFTADGSSQVIAFDGPVFSLVNGFQLRQVAAVPEPGTALAGLFAAGVCGFSRRRQKR